MKPIDQRLGVCSWSLKAASPAELCESVRACGVNKIQLALNPLSNAPEVWGDTAERLRDAGLEVVSGMFGCADEDYSTLESIRRTGGVMLDANWDTNRAIAERALQHALRMGVRLISTHVGFIPHDAGDPAHAKMLERVATIADLYASSDATLLLETGQESADDLEGFLAELNRPNVGVNFDPANMILYDKGDPIASLRRLLPSVRQVHIKDADRTTTPGAWGQEKRAGDGQVDWPAFLETLTQAGYTGDLIIEREAGPSRIEDVRAAKDLVLRLAARAAHA